MMEWWEGRVTAAPFLLLLLLSLLSLLLSVFLPLHFFPTTSPPLAPVACADHNSAAQGEKKQASVQATAERTCAFQRVCVCA